MSRLCVAHPIALAALAAVMAGTAHPAGAQTTAQAASQTASRSAAQTVEVVGVAPLPGLAIPRDQIPANVQTARADDLVRSQAADLSQFLGRHLASVQLTEAQGNPFQADVSFRGYTASPLLGSAQGLSVYLDGVRLNQPFGDVMSWDMLPKSAISTIALMPGSNPVFGLNTLGGALTIQTKDGASHPGSSVQASVGSAGRRALEFETGGASADGLSWFTTANRLHDDGWRGGMPSDLSQGFSKLGRRWGEGGARAGQAWLSVALADNRLHGSGLQEQGALVQDWRSVYSRPDISHNRTLLLTLAANQRLSDGFSVAGHVFVRRLLSSTLNGDINEAALDQPLYQPTPAEQAALAAAGHTGVPAAGESAANTAFPRWRCIASALLQTSPALACNGLINQTQTAQSQLGLAGQLHWQGEALGLAHQAVAGLAWDASRVQFNQGSELGYLTADHHITGVGALGDGIRGGTVDGAPYDTRVDLAARTRTASVYASDTLALGPRSHLTLAGRYNRSVVRSRDAITPGGGTGSLDGDVVFARLNPAVGLTFAASPGLTVYAGANQGSRAPSAVELGCADPENPCKLPNAMAGDPPLRQVVTHSFEAGLRGSGGAAGSGARWNLGLFRADNRDDILFVADNASGFGYFKNFGHTRRQGLEAGGSLRVAGLNLAANLTLLDATYQSEEVLNGASNSSNDQALAGLPGVSGRISVRTGDRIPLMPRQMFKLMASGTLAPGWQASADVAAVAGSNARGNENGAHQPDDSVYLGAGRSAGYALLNLGLEGRLGPGWAVFAQLNNALDRRYATAAQLGAAGQDAQGRFIARPLPANANGDSPLLRTSFLAAGAPRSLVLGLRYSFGDD